MQRFSHTPKEMVACLRRHRELIHTLVAETANRAPGLTLGNVHYLNPVALPTKTFSEITSDSPLSAPRNIAS